MIPTKSSKSKNQVMYKQKFKDPLSSTCKISLERRVLDLESQAQVQSLMEVPFCHWIYMITLSKASDSNIGIIAIVMCLWKPRVEL